ncbi:M12 family metallopeptidase [Arthrobacter sp. VKM Ac-2550]|uniref:M12 family metallopeptidase n=1 Tax=Crystallibacter permensis TaxID=1938888 RepID=UPI002225EC0F|nr:M12 family metallopeptidase [Arthrobacter sp. VKM Ac-2550]MCW2131575.1 Astacin (Peptidase family M12A) [Arthrobacter sp. VKM Ac-2550]
MEQNQGTGTNRNHFCTIRTVRPPTGNTKAALLNDTKWNATQLTVGFLEGDADLQQRVLTSARKWTGPDVANLKFLEATDGPSDIRVAFLQGDGSWSYLGTQAQHIATGEPTMNFGWLTPESTDDEVDEVVLHEFGHAIGLIHEHQNPQRPIQWNRAAVIADLSGPPNNWDEQTIEHNIFGKYNTAQVTGTDTDSSSIMMYPIPLSWTTDGFSAGFNSRLSGTDIEFIRGAYPW